MRRPPIFGVPPTGTEAQQYLHRARMFRKATLGMVDDSNGETFWPKYALLGHAIELALKGYYKHATNGGRPLVKEPANHDLVGWYELAVAHGLPRDPETAANVAMVNEVHESHLTRYPTAPHAPLPDVSVAADQAVDELIDRITEFVNPR